ncbi:hypothetical protein SAMN05443545_104327 [Aidingimonas halophila]|uniref:Uncharacterized protein n=1 Tax=Aidingimonas halophila TaxID=574349 RepID=A0A1H3A2K1_9GAMM|nr:hypothetical protein SAMN05443545_104327 [Aidingimonas halophila]
MLTGNNVIPSDKVQIDKMDKQAPHSPISDQKKFNNSQVAT